MVTPDTTDTDPHKVILTWHHCWPETSVRSSGDLIQTPDNDISYSVIFLPGAGWLRFLVLTLLNYPWFMQNQVKERKYERNLANENNFGDLNLVTSAHVLSVLQYWTAGTMPSKIVDVVCLGFECLSVQVSRGADQGTKLSKYLVTDNTDNTDWHEEIISDLDTISHHPDLEHTSTHKTRLMLWRQVPAKLNLNSSESYFQQNTEDNCGHRNELQLVVGCICHCII